MNNTGPAKRPPTRREFFPALARWGALAALVALVLYMSGFFSSDKIKPRPGESVDRVDFLSICLPLRPTIFLSA